MRNAYTEIIQNTHFFNPTKERLHFAQGNPFSCKNAQLKLVLSDFASERLKTWTLRESIIELKESFSNRPFDLMR